MLPSVIWSASSQNIVAVFYFFRIDLQSFGHNSLTSRSFFVFVFYIFIEFKQKLTNSLTHFRMIFSQVDIFFVLVPVC